MRLFIIGFLAGSSTSVAACLVQVYLTFGRDR